jgi:hypothetical protein
MTADAAASGRDRSAVPECLADFQGMTPQGLWMLPGVDRKHLVH